MSFYLSKILWLIINPLNIILLFIFSGIVVKIIFKNTLHKLFYFVSFIFFIIVAVIPTGEFMFYQLEKKFHTQSVLPSQVNGILILSGATNPQLTHEHNKIHLNGSVERLTESISLMQRYPNVKIIFAGGSGSIFDQELTHADVARNFFEQLNIDTENIIFESKSRNTYENILYSKKLAKPSLDENWIIVTSASHMIRATNIGKKLGWKFIPYAVDFQVGKKIIWIPSIYFLTNMNRFNSSSHEWIGLIAYYIMGRTNKIY